ncbi:hypothetical protein EIP91_010649 [Steccherinum ochraceum]|uniref:Uncharacterized protein n=1 Tax=Steccherinum ochraceum TaxID=92696 RepID=A0A4R0RZ13_9APHY|nr:hypothetical protein EIP91_010649 [Steccherinum ochraceum]
MAPLNKRPIDPIDLPWLKGDGEDGADKSSELSRSAENTSDQQDRARNIAKIRSDIPKRVREVLASDWNFHGTFAFSKSFTDAPNPILRLKPVGVIGLPLSERDAEVLKSAGSSLPPGFQANGSKASIWHLPPANVSIESKTWANFLESAVSDACLALGVDYASSQPQCHFEDTYLVGPGTTSFPSSSQPKRYTTDGTPPGTAFATMMVVLPSSICKTMRSAIMDSGEIIVLDYMCSDLSVTSIAAWYNGAHHQITLSAPGHSLVIAYRLVHTTTSIIPSLRHGADFSGQIEPILTFWRQKEPDFPEKLVFLLESDYSTQRYQTRNMQGVDAKVVPLLLTAAENLGLHTGFGSAVCSTSSSGKILSNSSGEFQEEGPEDHVSLEIHDFVDANMQPISNTLCLDLANEAVPADIADVLRNGAIWSTSVTYGSADKDSDPHEFFDENKTAYLHRQYRRSVLVIWLPSTDFMVRYPSDLQTAIKSLASPSLPTPQYQSEREKLLQYALNRFPQDPIGVTRAVCKVALASRDPLLWVRAVGICCADVGFAILPNRGIWDAVSAFGFAIIEPGITAMLKNEPRNARRFTLLDEVRTYLFQSRLPEDFDRDAWLSSCYLSVFSSIRSQHREDADPAWLKTFVLALFQYGNPALFVQTIVPQLKEHLDADLLRTLAVKLSERPSFNDTPHIYTPAHDLMHTAITKADLSALKKNQVFKYAITFLGACIGRYDDLTGLILEKFCEHSDTFELQSLERLGYVRNVLCSLALHVVENVKEDWRSAALPHIHTLITTSLGVACSEEPLATKSEGAVDRSRRHLAEKLNPQYFRALGKITEWHGGLKVLLSVGTYEVIIERLRQCEVSPTIDHGAAEGAEFAGIVQSLAEAWISRFDECYTGKIFKEAIRFCCKFHLDDAGNTMIQRAVDRGLMNHRNLKGFLVPLVASIRSFGEEFPIHSTHIASTVQKILLAWVEKSTACSALMASISDWGCSCPQCRRVMNSLKSPPSVNGPFTVKKLESQRDHVTQKVYEHFPPNEGRVVIKNTSGSAIQIILSDEFYDQMKWQTELVHGQIILKNLEGDDDALQILLGDHYERIMVSLRLYSNPSLSTSASTSVSTEEKSISLDAGDNHSADASNVAVTSRSVSSYKVSSSGALNYAYGPPDPPVHLPPVPPSESPPAKKRRLAAVLSDDEL